MLQSLHRCRRLLPLRRILNKHITRIQAVRGNFFEGVFNILLDNQEIDQIQQRRRHLEEIAEMGHDVYPNRFDGAKSISRIVERYQVYAGKKDDEAEAAL